MTDLDEFISHFGRKGMKWGVDNPDDHYSNGGGSTGSSKTVKSGKPVSAADEKKAVRVKRAKQVAIGVGVIAAVAGTAYVGHQMQKNGAMKHQEAVRQTKPSVKKTAEKILQQPTDMIYMSKPHREAGVTRNGINQTTLRFISKGKTEDYFEIFDKAGLNSEDFTPGTMRKFANGDVAAYYNDTQGRVDTAGRAVPHVVYVPANKATGLDSIDDVSTKLGPELERRYQEELNRARADST